MSEALTKEEKAIEAERASVAFELERQIKTAANQIHQAWWTLSEKLYVFHEHGYWGAVGYDTLDDFLAQPDLGISRSQFFTMTRLWRNLVITKHLKPKDLVQLEPSKVVEVTPAIMRGDVDVKDALDDAEALGYRDIKKKYRPAEKQKHGQAEDDSVKLDASAEPALVQCDKCGSWYDAGDDGV